MKRQVKVVIKCCASDETKREELINYNNTKSRIWLSKSILWATANNHYVMVGPAQEGK